MSNQGWFPDPSRVHESRFFDGTRWTEHVSTQGRQAVHQWQPAPPAADSASWYEPTTIRPAWEPQPTYPLRTASPQPTGSRSTGLIAAIAGAVVVVLSLVGVAVYAIANRDPGEKRPPIAASPSPQSSAEASPEVQPTPSPLPGKPGETGPTAPTGKPVLDPSARPYSVIGPTFAAGEPTYTMSFEGWPFAFRVPSTFGCLGATAPLPRSKAWVCINEQNPGAKHRISIMLRPCPTTCTPAEQRTMATEWFAEPGRTPVRRDATTSFLEFPKNDHGLYGLDMTHFFGAPGGPLRWQVGIYVESPTATKATMYKVVNDVRSQTA